MRDSYQADHLKPTVKWGLHLDWPLTIGLLALLTLGLLILYSATGQNMLVIEKQGIRLVLAFFIMLMIAQVPPRYLQLLAPWLYLMGLLLLVTVLVLGDIGKGAQRWLDLGIIRFQPSELMKLAVPIMLAQYLSDKRLPPSLQDLFILLALSLLPAVLIAKQPDLGTAVLIASAGFIVIFLAGISWRLVFGACGGIALVLPLLWYVMHDYQRQRVLTFLNPENDPLGSGYHIIQSKIAIGSGGLTGKGWLHGTQSHLQFLPERTTDFIFSVFGEEFGLLGGLTLLTLCFFIIVRGLTISLNAQDTFGRLLAGAISLVFFVYVFINIGMVCGLLPVVGIPLPLVSYGGTSMVTLMASFGVIMSIHSHRKLLAT